MDEAIEAINGTDLEEGNIIVERPQHQSSGSDQDGDCSRDLGRDHGPNQDCGGGGGGGDGECL